MMVAAISATVSGQKISEEPQPQRPPLGPSEKDNAAPRKPKNREINSRYLSSISSSSSFTTPSEHNPSRRCPSPNVGRASPFPDPSVPKRVQSAERRRPSTPATQSRPAAPTPDSKLSNAASEISTLKRLTTRTEVLWPSTRSLSVSFQGESFSLPISKKERQVDNARVSDTLRTPSNVGRKGTPERVRTTTPLRRKVGGDQLENSKPVDNSHSRVDQQRGAGRIRGNGSANPLTRSLDCSEKRSRAASLLIQGQSTRGQSVIRVFQQSINEGPVSRRLSLDGRLESDLRNADNLAALNKSDSTRLADGCCKISHLSRSSSGRFADGYCKIAQLAQDSTDQTDSDNGSNSIPCDLTSDSESVSSGSNSGTLEFRGIGGVGGRCSTTRGISVPARFWQETNSRLRRVQGLNSSLQESSSPMKTVGQPKRVSLKKGFAVPESPLSSPRPVSTSRSLSSPLRGPVRPASPSKLAVPTASPSRAMASPSRTRVAPMPFPSSVSSPINRSNNSSSIFSFIADIRRGKKGVNQIEDAHMLRLFYNRHLQWRFVNARADAALSAQRQTVENTLYNAWVTTSELRDSVTVKRIRLQQLRQDFKLTSILMGQMSYLEELSLLDRDHSSSLLGATEALKASTLRLPVIGGARADIQKVKDAVSSAVDVMQAMGSSVCSLLLKVEGMNSLVSELADMAAQERALLDECGDLLSKVAAIQAQECSLRTHLIQLKCGTKPNTRVHQILTPFHGC